MIRWAILLTLFLVVITPVHVYGQVLITEIMYDLEGSDSKREWIELHNLGTESVDLSSWRLVEGGVRHRLEGAIAPSTYVVVADNAEVFRTMYPGFSGQVVDSSFALGNSSEKIALQNEQGNEIDVVEYSADIGAAGDGQSLQRINGSWVASIPTPGLENVFIPPKPKSEPPVIEKVTRNVSAEVAVVETEPVKEEAESAIVAVGVIEENSSTLIWIGAIVLVVLVGVICVLLVHHKENDTIKIIEEYDD